MDDQLRLAVEMGDSFAEAAASLGVSRNAALSRWHRLSGALTTKRREAALSLKNRGTSA
jgi:hypothetical protein